MLTLALLLLLLLCFEQIPCNKFFGFDTPHCPHSANVSVTTRWNGHKNQLKIAKLYSFK
jgi:hypothetical protein